MWARIVLTAAAQQPVPDRVDRQGVGERPGDDARQAPLGVALYRQVKAEGNLILSPVIPSPRSVRAHRHRWQDRGGDRARLQPEDNDKVQALFGKDRSKSDGKVQLTSASAFLGVDEGYTFSQSFRDAFGGFDTTLDQLPFRGNPRGAVQAINSWVKAKTHGAIKKLYPEDRGPELSVRMVITNAVTFESGWSHPFPRVRNREEEFVPQGLKAVRVPMMHQTQEFRYAEDDGCST